MALKIGKKNPNFVDTSPFLTQLIYLRCNTGKIYDFSPDLWKWRKNDTSATITRRVGNKKIQLLIDGVVSKVADLNCGLILGLPTPCWFNFDPFATLQSSQEHVVGSSFGMMNEKSLNIRSLMVKGPLNFLNLQLLQIPDGVLESFKLKSRSSLSFSNSFTWKSGRALCAFLKQKTQTFTLQLEWQSFV